MDEKIEPAADIRSLSAELVRARALVICALERRGIASAEAEDLAHEACLAALRRGPDPAGPLGLFPWLLVVARRARRRRTALSLESEPEADEPSAEEIATFREDTRLLIAALANLSERERCVFRMRYVERVDLSTIARRLALPVGTIKSMLYRARESLTRRLGGRNDV